MILLTSPARAQAPDREGFGVGARLYGASLSIDIDGYTESASGGGAELRVGYRFNPTVSVFLSAGGATLQPEGENLDAYRFGTADLGAQFNLLPSRALNPYLRAALTGQVAAFDIPGTSDNLEARGGGITLGGGLLYAVSPKLSLDLSLDATGGRFTELVFDGDTTSNFDEIDSGIGRLGFGLVF